MAQRIVRGSKLMKRLLLIFVLLTSCYVANAQQESRFTHSMFTYNYVNPGSVGNSELGDASILIRQQNTGFKATDGKNLSPHSGIVNFSMPVKRFNSGIGLCIYSYDQGFENDLEFKLNYAYQAKIGDGKLGIGASISFLQIAFDKDLLHAEDENDVYLHGIMATEKYNLINAGFGAHYRIDRAYFGLSATRINQPKLKGDTQNYKYSSRHYYMYGGYVYPTNISGLTLKPSVFIRSTGASASSASLNAIGEYNNLFFGGFVYSTNNDISGLLGIEFKNGSKFDGMRASASFDLFTNKMKQYSPGSFEFNIGYAFSMNVEKTTKTYKSVRFL